MVFDLKNTLVMEMGRIFVFVILGIFGNLCLGNESCTRTSEECLLEDLFTGYQVYARPVLDPSDVVPVLLDFRPTSLISIDEKNEVMNLVGIMTAGWSDPRLQWNNSQYNDTRILNVRAKDIWLPDLALYNSADTFYHKTHREDFFAMLTPQGYVVWSFGGIFSTTCSLDIAHYPFDSQTCEIRLESWVYTDVYVDLIVNEDIDFSTFSNSSLWDQEDASVERTETPGDDGSVYAGIKYSITWKRKSLYYNFNIVLPVVLLLIVSLGIMWLPPECGERMSIAITVLLAFAVFLIVITDNLPTNSETLPVISEFVMLVMIATTIILLESLFIVALSFKAGSPPRWLRKFAFVYLACVFCSRDQAPEVEEKVDQDTNHRKIEPQVTDLESSAVKSKEKQALPTSEMAAILESVVAMQKLLEEKELVESHKDEWKLVGKMLDRLFFWLLLLAVVISSIILFSVLG